MQGHKRRHREQLDLPLSDKGRNGRRTLDPEIRREIVRHRPRRCSASRKRERRGPTTTAPIEFGHHRLAVLTLPKSAEAQKLVKKIEVKGE